MVRVMAILVTKLQPEGSDLSRLATYTRTHTHIKGNQLLLIPPLLSTHTHTHTHTHTQNPFIPKHTHTNIHLHPHPYHNLTSGGMYSISAHLEGSDMQMACAHMDSRDIIMPPRPPPRHARRTEANAKRKRAPTPAPTAVVEPKRERRKCWLGWIRRRVRRVFGRGKKEEEA
jgi:hypothetical protein